MDKPPQDHVRSYDSALDKALAIVCLLLSVPAGMCIAAVVWAVFKLWKGGIGAP